VDEHKVAASARQARRGANIIQTDIFCSFRQLPGLRRRYYIVVEKLNSGVFEPSNCCYPIMGLDGLYNANLGGPKSPGYIRTGAFSLFLGAYYFSWPDLVVVFYVRIGYQRGSDLL
jgi:hypothetical protein